MAYCFKCPQCGYWLETPIRDPAPTCASDAHDLEYTMRRDYRAEGVGLGSGIKVSRDGTVLDQARLFLPDNDEFAGPGDPDGTKGAREWLESHQPKESKGHNPLLEIERRSF